MIFNRAFYNELWFRLESDEMLGLLDSAYIEDFYGVDGQLILKNVNTGQEYSVLMSRQLNGISSVFTGYINLNTIPNGDFVLTGRVVDVNGNYRILSDFYIPDLSITSSFPVTVTGVPEVFNQTINGLTIFSAVSIGGVSFGSNTATNLHMNKDVNAQVGFGKDVSEAASIPTSATSSVRFNGNTSLSVRIS